VKKRISLNNDNNSNDNSINNSSSNNKDINTNDHKKELPIKFFFITFKKKKSVEMAIEKLNTWSQVTKKNYKDVINSEQNGFRILRMLVITNI